MLVLCSSAEFCLLCFIHLVLSIAAIWLKLVFAGVKSFVEGCRKGLRVVYLYVQKQITCQDQETPATI